MSTFEVYTPEDLQLLSGQDTVAIKSDLVAAQSHEPMLQATQSDFLERSLSVGKRGSKTITSRIAVGSENASLYPSLPFSLRSLIIPDKNVSTVHTHPTTPKLEHLKIHPISDQDIQTFMYSRFLSMVAIDRNGIQMLTRRHTDLDFVPSPALIHDSIMQEKGSDGNTRGIVSKAANTLFNYGGISYFYANYIPEPTHSWVVLRNVRKGALDSL